MKGGMVYFSIVAVVILGLVVAAMTISGGFQMLLASYGPLGVVGFIGLFLLTSVGFVAYVRRSLRRALARQDRTGARVDSLGQPDCPYR